MIGSNLSVVIDKKCVTIQKKLEPTNDDFGKTTCSEENTHESLNPSEIELLASSCQTSKREILPRNPTSGVQCKVWSLNYDVDMYRSIVSELSIDDKVLF